MSSGVAAGIVVPMHWHGEYDPLTSLAFLAYAAVLTCTGLAALDVGITALVRLGGRRRGGATRPQTDARARRIAPRSSWAFAGLGFLAVVSVGGSWPHVPCVWWDDAATAHDASCTLHEVRGALPVEHPLHAHWCSDVDPPHHLDVPPRGWALWLAHATALPLLVGLILGAWTRLWGERLAHRAPADP